MTKRDYLLLAKVFRLRLPSHATVDDVLTELVIVLKADNPNFDRERFYKACSRLPK